MRFLKTPAAGVAIFLSKRVAIVAGLLFIISLGTFLLLKIAPGDPVRILLGARQPTPETLEAIRAQHHLDDPIVTQFFAWLGDAVRLDFGESIRTSEPVRDIVLKRLGFSAQLALYAFLLVIATGVPLGVWAAVRRGRPADRSISAFGIIGSSTPAFVSSVVLIYLFAVVVAWFPPFGAGDSGWDRIVHLTLPAFALALSAVAIIIKLTRSAVVEVLDQDYVTFARARGLPERHVLVRYALRNALIPVVTAAGLILSYLVTGAVLVEVTFDLPGIGTLLVDSVNRLDLPVVQGATLAVALAVILINLGTDALYAAIDPRLRNSGKRS